MKTRPDEGQGTTPRIILSGLLKDVRHSGGINQIAFEMNLNPNRLRNYLLGFLTMPGELQLQLRIILDKRLKKQQKKKGA